MFFPRDITHTLMLALVAAAALPALAVNKCVDAGGKVTFTDTPCPTGQQASTMRIRNMPPASAVADAIANERNLAQAADQLGRENTERERTQDRINAASAAKAKIAAARASCGAPVCNTPVVQQNDETAWQRKVRERRLHPEKF